MGTSVPFSMAFSLALQDSVQSQICLVSVKEKEGEMISQVVGTRPHLEGLRQCSGMRPCLNTEGVLTLSLSFLRCH